MKSFNSLCKTQGKILRRSGRCFNESRWGMTVKIVNPYKFEDKINRK